MRKAIIILAAFLGMGEALAAGQNAAVSTNILEYANYGTLNMEGLVALSRHWSVMAGVRYNPFSYEGGAEGLGRQNKQQTYTLGARWWPWHIFSGWWMSGHLQYQEYNTGGLKSPQTREGDRVGAGVSGGYTYMLGKHMNLEVGAGVWTGADNYVKYACPRCGRTVDAGNGIFFLVNDVLLSLSYVF